MLLHTLSEQPLVCSKVSQIRGWNPKIPTKELKIFLLLCTATYSEVSHLLFAHLLQRFSPFPRYWGGNEKRNKRDIYCIDYTLTYIYQVMILVFTNWILLLMKICSNNMNMLCKMFEESKYEMLIELCVV